MTHWALWRSPVLVLIYVVTVEVVAIGASVATAFTAVPVTRQDLVRAAVLAGAAVVAIELTRQVERQREFLRTERIAYVDTKSVWSITAVIVLPPVLATAMVIWTYVVARLRIWPRRPPGPLYRWVFSCASVLCGTQTAVAVLALGMRHYPGVPASATWAGFADVGVILAALVLRWAINTGLVMGAIAVSTPETTARDLFAGFGQQLLEAGGAGLGIAAAVLVVVAHPAVLIGVVVALVAVHRGILLTQHQLATRLDVTTGAVAKHWWLQLAERVLDRAGDGVTGILFLDLDHFKQINDRYGHPNGDLVLRAVVAAVNAETRHEDLCGRLGGEEFALLVPNIGSTANLAALAERIRRRVHTIAVDLPDVAEPVDGLTVSIGAAAHPADGITTVDDLLRAADHALYLAKRNGRDRVQLDTSASSAD